MSWMLTLANQLRTHNMYIRQFWSNRFSGLFASPHLPAQSWHIQDQSTPSTYCPTRLEAIVNFYIPYIEPISNSPFWHHCAPNYFFFTQGITCIINDVCVSTPKRKSAPNLFSQGAPYITLRSGHIHSDIDIHPLSFPPLKKTLKDTEAFLWLHLKHCTLIA